MLDMLENTIEQVSRVQNKFNVEHVFNSGNLLNLWNLWKRVNMWKLWKCVEHLVHDQTLWPFLAWFAPQW